MEKIKIYREEELPENAKKMYLCRYAKAGGPCKSWKPGARCTFPTCRHTLNPKNAVKYEHRIFRKEGEELFVEVGQ